MSQKVSSVVCDMMLNPIEVYRRQIMTYIDGPRTETVKKYITGVVP